MTVGIICEYNPFHNGHVYHINKIKELYPNCLIVLVMSGNFTQRGEVSLIDKWKKTDIALNYVDLVVELPFVFAVQSADIFGKGAIDLLKYLNVDVLVFGSECDDIERLKKLAYIQESEDYNLKVKQYLNKGLNYPTSMSLALNDLCGDTVTSSNDLLGLSYIKNVKNSSIKCVSIKRTNDFLCENVSGVISSGSSIRKLLREGKDVCKYVPNISYENLDSVLFLDDFFDLLKFKIISEDISRYQTVDEGIQNRVKKVIYKCHNTSELIDKVKSKRYTQNRIRRMLIHILTGFTKKEAKCLTSINYIRVLGFNEKGRIYLNKIKKELEIPIITNFEKGNDCLNLELRVSSVYNLKNKNESLIEYKNKPIIH